MMLVAIALVLVALPFGHTEGISNKKWRVQVYDYSTPKCDANPLHPKGIELRSGYCTNMDPARSVTIHKHLKPGYGDWLTEVNHGRLECGVKVYDSPDCPDETGYNVLLPHTINQCAFINEPTIIRSAQFICDKSFPEHTSHVESVYTWTEWTTLDPTAVGVERKATVTVFKTFSTSALLRPAGTTALPDAAVEKRDDAAAAKEKKFDRTGVWIKHPFTYQWRCVACWHKKEDDKNEFRCEQGWDTWADCGTHPTSLVAPTDTVHAVVSVIPPKPDTVTTDTVTPIIVIPPIVTVTLPTVGLQKRGPKRYVFMKHPYYHTEVCAEAELHMVYGGHPAGVLEINGPKKPKKCSSAKPPAIPISYTEPATTTTTIYSTTTATTYGDDTTTEFTTTATSTAYHAPTDRGL
ncbi:hypothetical protein BDV96DRAFT_653999 [Lophiotrema nucula]|uniref:Uncharacterized protein n=1 Tax=Lophiotrema nucula TaxID=690887 RepID=A0A6A5YJL1_9PLEO|nr:hypothetical protein BDV96DRAFT_653999 [Lophiotrema nucula]